MTGGFAILAYPAEYRNSGVMTFIINQEGMVLRKGLGADTANIAKAIDAYDPDDTWNPVDWPCSQLVAHESLASSNLQLAGYFFFAAEPSPAPGTHTLSAAAISKPAASVEILTRCKPALFFGTAPKTK